MHCVPGDLVRRVACFRGLSPTARIPRRLARVPGRVLGHIRGQALPIRGLTFSAHRPLPGASATGRRGRIPGHVFPVPRLAHSRPLPYATVTDRPGHIPGHVFPVPRLAHSRPLPGGYWRLIPRVPLGGRLPNLMCRRVAFCYGIALACMPRCVLRWIAVFQGIGGAGLAWFGVTGRSRTLCRLAALLAGARDVGLVTLICGTFSFVRRQRRAALTGFAAGLGPIAIAAGPGLGGAGTVISTV